MIATMVIKIPFLIIFLHYKCSMRYFIVLKTYDEFNDSLLFFSRVNNLSFQKSANVKCALFLQFLHNSTPNFHYNIPHSLWPHYLNFSKWRTEERKRSSYSKYCFYKKTTDKILVLVYVHYLH